MGTAGLAGEPQEVGWREAKLPRDELLSPLRLTIIVLDPAESEFRLKPHFGWSYGKIPHSQELGRWLQVQRR